MINFGHFFEKSGRWYGSNPAENFLRFEQMGQDLTEWPEEEFGHIRILSDIAAKYLPAWKWVKFKGKSKPLKIWRGWIGTFPLKKILTCELYNSFKKNPTPVIPSQPFVPQPHTTTNRHRELRNICTSRSSSAPSHPYRNNCRKSPNPASQRSRPVNRWSSGQERYNCGHEKKSCTG